MTHRSGTVGILILALVGALIALAVLTTSRAGRAGIC